MPVASLARTHTHAHRYTCTNTHAQTHTGKNVSAPISQMICHKSQYLTIWSPIHGPESQQPIVTATEESCLGPYKKINDAAASFSRSSPPPPPFPPPPPPSSSQYFFSVPFTATCFSAFIPSSPSSSFLLPLYVPFFIYFFDISVHTPPPPSQLQIVESRKHTHTVMHACSTANIKICASWHSTERETHTVTEWRWCLIGGLLESSANKRRWSPPGCLPLRLKLPMKLWHVQEGSFTAAIYTVTEGTHHAAIHRQIIEDPPANAAQNIRGDVVPPCVCGGSLLSEAASNLFWEFIQTVSTTCFEKSRQSGRNLWIWCRGTPKELPHSVCFSFRFRL